ncbi:hypothetical protein [Streptomyces sp. B21-101]|uniref:hypothetical protein n=1 Tax=Streptomyces sp. B21-101 TaxID=3039415 RepID=UPI002FF245C8
MTRIAAGKAGFISQRSIDCCTMEVFGYAMDDHYRNSLPRPPPHFADGISVAHVHPTSTSRTRLFARESGLQAVVAGEYHPLNGKASESSPGCFGQDSKGIAP